MTFKPGSHTDSTAVQGELARNSEERRPRHGARPPMRDRLLAPAKNHMAQDPSRQIWSLTFASQARTAREPIAQ